MDPNAENLWHGFKKLCLPDLLPIFLLHFPSEPSRSRFLCFVPSRQAYRVCRNTQIQTGNAITEKGRTLWPRVTQEKNPSLQLEFPNGAAGPHFFRVLFANRVFKLLFVCRAFRRLVSCSSVDEGITQPRRVENLYRFVGCSCMIHWIDRMHCLAWQPHSSWP